MSARTIRVRLLGMGLKWHDGEEPVPKDRVHRYLRSRTFFRFRVGVLLTVLMSVTLWAWHDVRSRHARTSWDHTLQIAIILLRRDGVDDNAIDTLRARVPVLEARFTDELRRHRSNAPKPFHFTVLGPVDVSSGPPTALGDSLIELTSHTYKLWRFLRVINERAGVDSSAFDTRIYVTVRPPASAERQFVEGESEQEGRVGTVNVELTVDTTDFALFVVAHEALHTLGATDKYDAQGWTLIPAGLAEPDREPRFPQRYAEVMARKRPVTPGEERVPESLDELAVGPTTAREIGWVR